MASKCSYSRPTSACARVWCSDDVERSSCQRDCSAGVMEVCWSNDERSRVSVGWHTSCWLDEVDGATAGVG